MKRTKSASVRIGRIHGRGPGARGALGARRRAGERVLTSRAAKASGDARGSNSRRSGTGSAYLRVIRTTHS